MSRLKRLSLSKTRTDAGLAYLKRMAELEYFNMSTTRIKGLGLVSFKGLANLSYLALDRTEIGDEGLKNLAPLPPKLVVLQLFLRGSRTKQWNNWHQWGG